MVRSDNDNLRSFWFDLWPCAISMIKREPRHKIISGQLGSGWGPVNAAPSPPPLPCPPVRLLWRHFRRDRSPLATSAWIPFKGFAPAVQCLWGVQNSADTCNRSVSSVVGIYSYLPVFFSTSGLYVQYQQECGRSELSPRDFAPSRTSHPVRFDHR